METELASPPEHYRRSMHRWISKPSFMLQPEKTKPSSPSSPLSPFSSASSSPRSLAPAPSSRDVARILLLRHNSSKRASANNNKMQSTKKAGCLCAPTTHPGSFRCHRHRAVPVNAAQKLPPPSTLSSNATTHPIMAAASSFSRRGQYETRLSRFCPLSQPVAVSSLYRNRSI